MLGRRVIMKKKARWLSALLLAAMMGAVIACSAVQEGSLLEAAAVRGEEGLGEYYIDPGAIALASRATTTKTMDLALEDAYNLCNDQRAARNLKALRWDNNLADAAKVRAQEIVQKFSHTRPNGTQWWTVNSDVQWGENLAKLYGSAPEVVTAWMNSPTHAANILDSEFKTVGMSIYQTNNKWYWAQEFGY
ncbi:MAG: CAP domain-containing protein [Lachnospiraceae bacterium]|nr:CAP domain-containing protein [Lachnospiraceae bacterium]